MDLLYIVWNEQNNNGISILDEQHRGIVSAINTFYYFYRNGVAGAALLPTLQILEQYTVLHFKTEEELLKQAGYAKFDEHVALHKDLIQKTVRLRQGDLARSEPERLLQFLRDWWLGHISAEDGKYVTCLRELLRIA